MPSAQASVGTERILVAPPGDEADRQLELLTRVVAAVNSELLAEAPQ